MAASCNNYPAKIEFISDKIKYIKNTILSLNLEGLQLFILTIIPWAGRSRHCCFQTLFKMHFVVKYLKIYRPLWSQTRSYDRWKQPHFSEHCIMGYRKLVPSSYQQSNPRWRLQSSKELAFPKMFTQFRDLPQAGKYSEVISQST